MCGGVWWGRLAAPPRGLPQVDLQRPGGNPPHDPAPAESGAGLEASRAQEPLSPQVTCHVRRHTRPSSLRCELQGLSSVQRPCPLSGGCVRTAPRPPEHPPPLLHLSLCPELSCGLRGRPPALWAASGEGRGLRPAGPRRPFRDPEQPRGRSLGVKGVGRGRLGAQPSSAEVPSLSASPLTWGPIS